MKIKTVLLSLVMLFTAQVYADLYRYDDHGGLKIIQPKDVPVFGNISYLDDSDGTKYHVMTRQEAARTLRPDQMAFNIDVPPDALETDDESLDRLKWVYQLKANAVIRLFKLYGLEADPKVLKLGNAYLAQSDKDKERWFYMVDFEMKRNGKTYKGRVGEVKTFINPDDSVTEYVFVYPNP